MNKKLIIALVVVIVLGGAAWAYYATRANYTASQNSTSDHSQSGDEHNDVRSGATDGSEITYTDQGFSPSNLGVAAGTVITVKNQSSGPLEFSSADHPTHTKDPELNLSTIQPGKDATLTLTKAGTWGYHNHLKANDTGMITVK